MAFFHLLPGDWWRKNLAENEAGCLFVSKKSSAQTVVLRLRPQIASTAMRMKQAACSCPKTLLREVFNAETEIKDNLHGHHMSASDCCIHRVCCFTEPIRSRHIHTHPQVSTTHTPPPMQKRFQVPANEAYSLKPMPVPAVLVTLHGVKGGLLLDEDTGKEVSSRERETERSCRFPQSAASFFFIKR